MISKAKEIQPIIIFMNEKGLESAHFFIIATVSTSENLKTMKRYETL